MALVFVKRSSIPVAVKGKSATNPTVTISDKGQMILNSLATKFLGSELKAAVAYDAGVLYLFRKGSKSTEKLPDSELWAFLRTKGMKDKTSGIRKDGTSCFCAVSRLLTSKETFGDNIYDYAKSGTQTFTATADEKNGCLKFSLPVGALIAKPKVARVKKVKQVVNGIAATPDSTVGVPVGGGATEEIILDV
jgi:hypothetical protein